MTMPILVLLLVVITPASPSQGGDALLDGLRTNDALIAQAYLMAARRANQNPGNLPAQLKAARYAFAVLHVADPSRHDDLARSLLRFGRRALQIHPDSAEGRLWVGVGMGQIAIVNDLFRFPQVRERYEQELKRSIALDASCLSGLAQLHLARTYAQAAAHFESAVTIDPDAMFERARKRFPANPLADVYQSELRFREANPTAGLALLDRLNTLEPATPFEGLMKLATRAGHDDEDSRLLAWLE